MKRHEAERYARIIVASAVFHAPHGLAYKTKLVHPFTQMRFALRAKGMTEALMWDTVSALLHEGLIRRDKWDGAEVYGLTADGELWLVGAINGMGLEDAWFRRTLVQCGMNPDVIITRMLSIGQALKTKADLKEGLVPDESYLGYVTWRMRWQPDRRWSIQELAKVLALAESVVATQIDAAMRMGWLHIHEGRTYSLTSLGVAGAARKMHALMAASSTADRLIRSAGLKEDDEKGNR